MNKYSKQFGFSLLELLISIVAMISLSVIGIAVAQRYASHYNYLDKTADSISMLHDALTTYYFTKGKQTRNMTIADLENEGIIQKDFIFTNQGIFQYNLQILPNELVIQLETLHGISLQSLHPNEMFTFSKIKHGKKYLYTVYRWIYPPLLK